LVPEPLRGAARDLAAKIKEDYNAQGRAPGGPTPHLVGLPEQGLRRLIAEEVKKAVQDANYPKPPARTWANVVAGSLPREPPAPQKVSSPPATRELLV